MIKHIFTLADLASILGKSKASVTADIKNKDVTFSQKDEDTNRYHLTLEDIVANVNNLGSGRKGAKVLTFGNIKGGTGKTSIVSMLGTAFSKFGFRVLLIDSDKQANLSDYFLDGPSSPEMLSLYNVFIDKDPGNVIQHTRFPNIDIIPANLRVAEIVKMQSLGVYTKLKKYLENFRSYYDMILIDTPPEISITVDSTICAADYIFSVITADKWSLMGIDYIKSSAHEADETFKNGLKVNGCIFNMVNERRRLDQDIIDSPDGTMKGIPVLKTRIPQFQAFKELFVSRNPFFDNLENKHIKLAFDLAVEVLNVAS